MAAPQFIYVVFPAGRKPTPAQLHSLGSFGRHFADGATIGYDIDTRRPAIRFPREAFLRLRTADVQFESLITAWDRHGCPVQNKLHFMEDPTTLQEPIDAPQEPMPEPARKRRPEEERPALAPPDFSDLVVSRQPLQESLEHKQARAQESQAISRLGTLEHVLKAEAIGNFARYVPGLLGILIFALIVTAGVLMYNRVSNSKMEPRRDTIERMTKQPVKRGARNSERGAKTD